MKSPTKQDLFLKGAVPVIVVMILVSTLIGLFFRAEGSLESESLKAVNLEKVSIRDYLIHAPNSAAWFLIGGMSALVLFILINWRKV